MEHIMEPMYLKQRGNTLEVKFDITEGQNVDVESPKFVINGKAVFQVMFITFRANDGKNKNHVFVSFHKQRPDESLDYNIKLTCDEFAIKDKCFTSDDGTWHRIHENTEETLMFRISVVMSTAPPVNSFALLHDDEQLTDFELRGEGGAVRVHRSVLAATSPVLKRMLCGTWRETTEGYVKIPGASKETLQNLKNYIYLHTLPETGLEHLLLLASCYMIPNLEQKCVDALTQNLTAQNTCDLLQFAVKNNVTRLMLTIFDSIGSNEVKANDIRDHVNKASADAESSKESNVGD